MPALPASFCFADAIRRERKAVERHVILDFRRQNHYYSLEVYILLFIGPLQEGNSFRCPNPTSNVGERFCVTERLLR